MSETLSIKWSVKPFLHPCYFTVKTREFLEWRRTKKKKKSFFGIPSYKDLTFLLLTCLPTMSWERCNGPSFYKNLPPSSVLIKDFATTNLNETRYVYIQGFIGINIKYTKISRCLDEKTCLQMKPSYINKNNIQ